MCRTVVEGSSLNLPVSLRPLPADGTRLMLRHIWVLTLCHLTLILIDSTRNFNTCKTRVSSSLPSRAIVLLSHSVRTFSSSHLRARYTSLQEPSLLLSLCRHPPYLCSSPFPRAAFKQSSHSSIPSRLCNLPLPVSCLQLLQLFTFRPPYKMKLVASFLKLLCYLRLHTSFVS